MAMKYRKKPVVVEAIQWTGKNLQELKNFVGDSLEYDVMDAAWEVGKGPVIVNVRIQTLEGIHHASVGDFIIKGIRGEFYPCKPDIFAKTYESSTLTPPNEWISVEDEIPSDDDDGLEFFCMTNATGKGGGVLPLEWEVATIRGKTVRRWRWLNRISPWKVTHWMKRPAPPEKENSHE